jgi:hypothetical protein
VTEELKDITVSEEERVEDDSSIDDIVAPIRYDISSYGADYDVEGLVKRLDRGDILVPRFQRNYVWNYAEASRFVESLLLGLPVPAIFLAREPESNKLLVIDGQQRLKTLQFFYNGYFNPQEEEETRKIFKLIKVQPEFDGLTYATLLEKDRVKLNDSLIHAIIIKQESPQDGDTSIYHIFDRLNSEGRSLTPQEIRAAVDHGKFIDFIKELNDSRSWREIYGKKNSRLKDQELILRFLAFYFDVENYEKPMKEFLNKFSQKNRKASNDFLAQARKVFTSAIDVACESLGKEAFRPTRSINAAVLDSVMVGLARRIESNSNLDKTRVKRAYDELLANEKYIELISQSTSDEKNVSERFRIATDKFMSI